MARTDAKEADKLVQLEGIIDALGMSRVIEALGNIAAEKADHILASYSDEALAKDWARAADYLGKLSASHRFKVISP